MAFNPEVSSINQRLQFGLESTPGTGVAANKLLQCYDLQFAPEANTNEFTPTGRKYPSIVIENSESSSATMTGILDYNGIVYALSGLSGAATIGGHLSSATAKDWVFSPPLTGSVQPQTFTIEHGDSAIANTPFKVNYGLFTELGYKIDRTAGATISGKLIAQNLQTAITMTSTPTAIAIQPSAGKHFNVYLDTTSGGLGVTQLLKVISVDYTWSNLYGPFYPLNRTNLGWTAHVDMKPTCTVKLTMEADATGLNSILTLLQSSATQFMRVDGQGLQIASDGPGAVYAEFKHDMAVKASKPNPFQDANGVYAIDWDFTIVEDATWTHSQIFTITNLLTAL